METCVQLFLWYFSCRSHFSSYIEILRQAKGLDNLPYRAGHQQSREQQQIGESVLDDQL